MLVLHELATVQPEDDPLVHRRANGHVSFCDRVIPYRNAEMNMSPQVGENVTWKKLGDSVVVLNLTDSTYYVLNETASAIFRSIVEKKSPEEIAAEILAGFDCTADQAQADIAETIAYLETERLVCGAE